MLQSKISSNTSIIRIYYGDRYEIHHSSDKSYLRMSQGIFTKFFYIRNLTIGIHTPLNILRVYEGGILELVLDNKIVMVKPNIVYRLT